MTSLGIALIQKSPSAPRRGAAVRALQEVTALRGKVSSPIRGTAASSPFRGSPPETAGGPLARAPGDVLDLSDATGRAPPAPERRPVPGPHPGPRGPDR